MLKLKTLATYQRKLSGIILGMLMALLSLFLSSLATAEEHMDIRLIVGEKTLFVTLENSPTGRDFRAMLPLTLRLRDFNHTEKISGLPRKLSTKGAPEGYQPSAGDLALFVPWGNLAIYYRDASWYPGLIKIGHITTDIEDLVAMEDGVAITIEQVK